MGQKDCLNFHLGLGQGKDEIGLPGAGKTLLGQEPKPASQPFPSRLSLVPSVCPFLFPSLSFSVLLSSLLSSPMFLEPGSIFLTGSERG